MLIVYAVILVVCVAADQITKALICPMLIANGNKMTLIPGVIELEYTQNTGMAWGLLQDATLLLTVFSIVFAFAIGFIVIKTRRMMPKLIGIAFTLVVAGALGNLIDRIALHFVRDFITFSFVDFPIFNVADICVTVGSFLIIGGFFLTRSGREFYKQLDSKLKKDGGDDPDGTDENGGTDGQAHEQPHEGPREAQ